MSGLAAPGVPQARIIAEAKIERFLENLETKPEQALAFKMLRAMGWSSDSADYELRKAGW